MKAYDYTEKAKHELEKQRSLEAIDARLTRHEKVTWITLILVVILSGLSLALLVTQLINHSN
jgi:cell division protein FtsL